MNSKDTDFKAMLKNPKINVLSETYLNNKKAK